MTIYGETPYMQRGGESHYRKLFYSRPEQALIKDITLQSGYGILKSGTVLAINKSAAGNVNRYVPYNPTVPNSADPNQVGRAFALQTISGTTVYVTLKDSYKFKVGDDVIIGDSGTACENMGAITAIDRTTYGHMAVITFTATVSGSFTIAESAWVAVEAGDSSNGYSDAVGILTNSVDTGEGENAKGALGAMLLSNAVLYYGCINNIDAAALVDLSGSHDGNFLVIK
jgi:hypothetical protein